MEKLDGKSKDIIKDNIDKLKMLFPDVFTEDGVDFGALKDTLGEYVGDKEERYQFTWHGKTQARRLAQTPSTGTLRPCKEESVNWDTTENIFIEGDNLEVLKLLQKSYNKKIKMIYIDPPYNTGKDFVYKDNFKDNIKNYLELTGQVDSEGKKLSANSEMSGRYHTDWLNMMYPRLKLARNLLKDDGVIFISIDDNEISNLRKVCDEIFGEGNFIDCLIWKKRYGGGAKEKYLISVHEYVLIYAKDVNCLEEIFIPLTKESIKRYYTLKDNNCNIRGPYRTHPLEATKSMGDRPNLVFSIKTPDGKEVLPKRQWLWGKERVSEALQKNEIEFIKDKKGSWSIHTKQYLKDENGQIRQGKAFSLIDDIFTQHGTNEIIELFGNAQVFSFPKPASLIAKLIQVGLPNKDDIVLDFFSGSCSVANAVLDLNKEDMGRRKFIMVQLPEPCDEKSEAFKAGYKTIAEIGKERIRRVIKKIEAEQKENKKKESTLFDESEKAENKSLDLGFKVFKLDSSNISTWNPDFDTIQQDLLTAVDNIKTDRKEEDVLYEILLKYGLDLTLPIEELILGRDPSAAPQDDSGEGKKVFVIGLGALIVCLASDVTIEVIEEIAKLKEKYQPEVEMRVVFKDSSFKDDVLKTNAIQILKQHGIEDVKSI